MFLIAAATVGRSLPSEDGEHIAKLIGAAATTFANLRNFVLCRRTECDS